MDYLDQQISELKKKIKANQELLSDPALNDLAIEEIQNLQKQIEALEASRLSTLDLTAVNSEEYSPVNSPAIIEVRSAAGGDEAKIFSQDLIRMYSRFCLNQGLKLEQIDDDVIKVLPAGRQVLPSSRSSWPYSPYQTFRFEAGVHRVQRVPATESQGRIHTSTATVTVLPVISPKQVEVKESDLEWQFTRSGGPGGQNVNKVNTAVRLTHKPSGLLVSVRQERTQARNKEIALELLRSELWQSAEDERLLKIQKDRSKAVGRGARSEKIKTYNFPQNRLTDHRLNKSWYSLKDIIEGNLDEVLRETIESLFVSSRA